LQGVVNEMTAIAAGDVGRSALVRVAEPASARGNTYNNSNSVTNNFTFPVSGSTERAAIRAANVLRPRF